MEIDERIIAGLRDQLAMRDELLRTGERQIGWKVGFAAPAALDKLGTDRPLVGFLLESALLPDGASVPIGGWTAPALEPEIAVHLGRDVPIEATWDQVRDAIAGLSAAIELADVTPPPEDPRAILAGNIFQRHVMLGPVDESRSTAEGIGGRVIVGGSVAVRGEVHVRQDLDPEQPQQERERGERASASSHAPGAPHVH